VKSGPDHDPEPKVRAREKWKPVFAALTSGSKTGPHLENSIHWLPQMAEMGGFRAFAGARSSIQLFLLLVMQHPARNH
jgi:hypothetical protein